MNDSAYRDARLGLLAHIEDADLAVAQRRERVTKALWQLLPSEVRARITTLSEVELPEDASFEVLTKIADQRLELVDALDEALELAPQLLHGVTDAEDGVPAQPSQEDTWGPIGTETAIVPLREHVRRIAAGLDADADVSVSGARITARLTVEGVPIVWRVELGAPVTINRGFTASSMSLTFLRARHVAEVNVPADLPRLSVRPEGLSDAVLKALALERELTLGDKGFDDVCFVEGDEAFAPQLLDEGTRSRLVERVSCGDFRLSLDSGVARVSWSRSGMSTIDDDDTIASLRVLAALRHAAANVKLVKEP